MIISVIVLASKNIHHDYDGLKMTLDIIILSSKSINMIILAFKNILKIILQLKTWP